MPVPDYQAAMLPLLRLVSERQTVKLSECIDMLADHFGLTTTERSEMLDSGVQSRWGNRVSWAASYLVHAGVLRRPAKGILEVTDAGKQLLVDAPDALTNSYLMRYPSFVEFKQKSKSAPSSGAVIQPGVETAGSPTDILEATYQEYRRILAQDLLSQTKLVSPSFFERLVVQLLVKMGYGGSFKDAAQAIGKTGDGGIDGIIKEDRLGLDFVAVQAKRWENSVGREVIQTFAGSLMGHGASKGVLITTSAFTSGAKEYAQKISTNKIVLIDGEQLAELMLDYGIGVTDVTNYRIQRVDSDYFEAE
jgi:restriction system protein